MARHPDTRKGFDSASNETQPGKPRPRVASKPPPIPRRKGQSSSPPIRRAATPPPPDGDDDVVDSDPTEVSGMPSGVMRAAARDRSAPIQVISMKTPAELAADAARPAADPHVIRQVQMRSMAEVSAKHASLGGRMGNLAPPRDEHGARDRRTLSNVMWASIALALAAIVAAIVWFLAH